MPLFDHGGISALEVETVKQAKINTKDLEVLIEELTKSQPNQELVKSLMLKQGIPYNQDPFQQMNQVLVVMNNRKLVKTLKEKETSL